MNAPADRLAQLLGTGPAQALRQALALRGRMVEPAVPEWTAHGHTGARLVAVVVYRAGDGPLQPRLCLVKVCPPGSVSPESARHSAALDRSPPAFAAEHLVALAFDPIACPDGTVLLGQEIAGAGLARLRPLSELASDELPAVCATVLAALLDEWTGDAFGLAAPVPAGTLLRRELRAEATPAGELWQWGGAAGLLAPGRDWVSTAEDGVMPNPLAMAADPPAHPGPVLRYLTGRTHGDLHDDNVLIRRERTGVLRPEQFRLVDLATFDHDGPLSRDVAALLLAVIARPAGGLPAGQQEALLRHLVGADASCVDELPPNLVRLVDAIGQAHPHRGAAAGWSDSWDLQLLVSIQAAALRHTRYRSIGAAGRWWCLRLAARAAMRLVPAPPALGPAPMRLHPGMLDDPTPSATTPTGTSPTGTSHTGTTPTGANPTGANPTGATPTSAEPGRAAPAAAPPAVWPEGPPPRPLTLAERSTLVDALADVPVIRDPGLRQQVYDDLPAAVVQQLPRHTVLRHELFALVRLFDEYRALRPWPVLIEVLRCRLPGDPTVAAVGALLRRYHRLDATADG